VRLIYEALEGSVETIFDDQIIAIDEQTDGAQATLKSGRTLAVDAVVGADGLHSAVRALQFGPENDHELFLGYAVAAFEVTGYRPRDEDVYVIHPTPGHQMARFALRDDRTQFLLVFRGSPDAADTHLSGEQIRALVRDEFKDAGWEAEKILAAMDRVSDVYFDRMSQIRLPRWHTDRTVLLGDAAAAVSLLAGEGTGLAMTEAYMLADEPNRCNGDPRSAFQAYDHRLRPFIEGKQRSAAKFAARFVPSTRLGVWARNQATALMRIDAFAKLFLGSSLRDDFELPDA